MAIVYYTQQSEYDLVHDEQYCIGWTATDQSGNKLGEVTEMLINTETEMIDSILVDRKKRIPAQDFSLQNKQVVVRGVYGGEAADVDDSDTSETYEAMPPRTENANYIAGLTREPQADENVVPIVEEQFRVGKRTVETGGVRVHTNVENVPVEENVTLREEHVTVERHAVNRPVDAAALNTFREGEIELTERAEVPVVSKEARVVEEVSLGKEVFEHDETVRDTVRRTEVEVEENVIDDDVRRRTANS